MGAAPPGAAPAGRADQVLVQPEELMVKPELVKTGSSWSCLRFTHNPKHSHAQGPAYLMELLR